MVVGAGVLTTGVGVGVGLTVGLAVGLGVAVGVGVLVGVEVGVGEGVTEGTIDGATEATASAIVSVALPANLRELTLASASSLTRAKVASVKEIPAVPGARDLSWMVAMEPDPRSPPPSMLDP